MAEKKKDKKPAIEIKNRRAEFEYKFLDTYEAGIVLQGTEIKSIRKRQSARLLLFFQKG